jgi:hypothetical protein
MATQSTKATKTRRNAAVIPQIQGDISTENEGSIAFNMTLKKSVYTKVVRIAKELGCKSEQELLRVWIGINVKKIG